MYMEAAMHILHANRLRPPFPPSSAALQPVFDSCQSGSAVRFSQIRFLYLKIFASTAVADACPSENSGKLKAGKNASGLGDLLEF